MATHNTSSPHHHVKEWISDVEKNSYRPFRYRQSPPRLEWESVTNMVNREGDSSKLQRDDAIAAAAPGQDSMVLELPPIN
jgi:hypothetical protein